MGLQSNFGSLLRRLEGVWDTPAHAEMDGRKLAVAEKCRKIRTKLEACPPEAREILFKAFGGAYGAVDLVGVMTLSAPIQALYRASKTKRPFGEWLARMRDSKDAERRRAYSFLRLKAETLVEGAVRWYEASDETPTQGCV